MFSALVLFNWPSKSNKYNFPVKICTVMTQLKARKRKTLHKNKVGLSSWLFFLAHLKKSLQYTYFGLSQRPLFKRKQRIRNLVNKEKTVIDGFVWKILIQQCWILFPASGFTIKYPGSYLQSITIFNIQLSISKNYLWVTYGIYTN